MPELVWKIFFKPTTGNKSLHEISNDSVVSVVNLIYLKTHCQRDDVPASQCS
jgi:hypothetical protein